ncbi:hypothetical protein [Nocardia sp. NPDC051570]|uniref:hypothetical protein n=1 Tax=Nocardia sp. NPDC051570 TaxID=3364324 RepID=UPI00378E9090
MAVRRSPHSNAGQRLNAGIGGAGSGTLLITIAQHIGVDTIPGLVFLYSAPILAVVTGAAFDQVRQWTEWYGEWAVIRRARRTLEKQLNNPNTSTEHKKDIRCMLEQMDHTIAVNHLARVKSIKS